MKESAIAIGLSVLMLLSVTIASQKVYAHTFSGDESASFLALVEVLKVHLQLAQRDATANPEQAVEHAEHAIEHLDQNTIDEISERNERLGRELPASLTELQETLESGNHTAADIDQLVTNVDDLLGETVTVRIESAQLTNSTVQGLMMANLVDEILENYNSAFGIEEEHEHDEGAIQETDDHAHEDEEAEASNSTSPTDEELDELTTFELAEQYPDYLGEESANASMSEGNETHDTIVSMHAYNTAVVLTARVQELFDTKLRAMAEANATEAAAALEAGLDKLQQAIENEASPDDVAVIAHTEVHANIQKAYNLQIIPEFPLAALLLIPAIMSTIVIHRLRRNP
jgi:hypothetical protein